MKIKIIKEVYSDKQRKFMCAMKKPGVKRPKGLSKAEAEEMCSGPMKKEEQLEEISAMAGGGIAGHVDEKEEIDELLSTSGLRGGMRIKFSNSNKEHRGHVERSKHQGLRNVMEDDDTKPTQGSSDDFAGIGWKLSDFADNSKNASRVFSILQEIEEKIGIDKLRQAVLSDSTAKSRTDVMASKFGYDTDLLQQIQDGDQASTKRYYQFLINEYLFWIAYNPMSSAQQYSGRGAMLSRPTKDLAYGLISQYVSDPSKNNPKSKGQRIAAQAKDYKLDQDLDQALYNLPE